MVIKRGWLENSLYMVLSALQQIALDVFSRRRSEGFPFIVWGSGGWTLVRLEWLVASSSRRRRVVNSVSMGETKKPLLFEGFQAGCHVVLRASFVVQRSTGKCFVQAL